MVEPMIEQNVLQIVVEVVASASFLRKNWKQMLSDTCRVRNKTAHDALLQSLRYHGLLSM